MVQTLDLPALGILFKIEKIEGLVDSGNYLVGAWKVFWRALGPENLKDFSEKNVESELTFSGSDSQILRKF